MLVPTKEEIRHDHRARKDAIAKIQFPLKGQWPGFERPKKPVFHNLRRITDVWDEAGPAALKNRAIKAMKQLGQRTDIAGLRFAGWLC
jgi:hypothetical protein